MDNLLTIIHKLGILILLWSLTSEKHSFEFETRIKHCNKKRRSKDILNCYQLLNESSTDERGKRDIQVPKPNVGNMISEGYSGQRPHIFGHT